jgi:protein-tyrosine phosphatase
VAHVLVICTGNICRSPIAEGSLRNALDGRFGGDAPSVDSAGTQGWEGAAAQPGSVAAAAERQIDISGHVARLLTPEMIRTADLILAMAAEHRDVVAEVDPEALGRTFTLKELVRLLDALPAAEPGSDAGSLADRVAEAQELRSGGFAGNPYDQDVADPLGQPQELYRAIAWELDVWIERLVDGLFGAAEPTTSTSSATKETA